MLEKIEQLSLDVSNIIIYTNSAILQNGLNKKIRERFKIEKNLTKYADSAATLKIAKSESFMPPFGGGIWLVDVKCDSIPIKEIAKAIKDMIVRGAPAIGISGAHGVAIDKSRRALRVARHNIKTLGLGDKIQTQYTTFDMPCNFGMRFDIIVSNPPYIAQNDNRVNDGAQHDPDMALYAEDNGLAAYKSIAKHAKDWITDDGKLYLEIGIDQGTDIKLIFIPPS